MDFNVNETRLLAMLSLAKKAGKLVTGEEGCEKAIQKGEAKIVFLATDASKNTHKKFNNKTTFYKVPIHSIFTKDVMGQHIGSHSRATIVVVCENFAKKMNELIEKCRGGNLPPE